MVLFFISLMNGRHIGRQKELLESLYWNLEIQISISQLPKVIFHL